MQNNSAWQTGAAVLRKWIGEGRPISTIDLAVDVERDEATISNYKKGHTVPDAVVLGRIAAVYGVSHPSFVLELFNDAVLCESDFRIVDGSAVDRAAADVNGNGRIDPLDSMLLGTRVLTELTEFLNGHARAIGDSRLTSQEAEDGLRRIEDVKRELKVLETSLIVQARPTLRAAQ